MKIETKNLKLKTDDWKLSKRDKRSISLKTEIWSQVKEYRNMTMKTVNAGDQILKTKEWEIGTGNNYSRVDFRQKLNSLSKGKIVLEFSYSLQTSNPFI